MKRALLIIMLMTTGSAFGQLTGRFLPFEEVKQFLQLSDAQVQNLLLNTTQHSLTVSGKRSRIGDVQREIAAETAKEQLDPMALGVRYVEVETLCREIRTTTTELITRNQALLNADQKAKLKVLEDAIKLAPVIQQAQIFSLLENGGFSGPTLLTGSAIGYGLLGGSDACSQSLIGALKPFVNRKQITQ